MLDVYRPMSTSSQANEDLKAACQRAEAASAERDVLELERAAALDLAASLQVPRGPLHGTHQALRLCAEQPQQMQRIAEYTAASPIVKQSSGILHACPTLFKGMHVLQLPCKAYGTPTADACCGAGVRSGTCQAAGGCGGGSRSGAQGQRRVGGS